MSTKNAVLTPRRQRLLNANAKPARTLLALHTLSEGLAANDAVETGELQAYVGDATNRTHFAERVMLPLHQRGLVFKARQHGWRLSAEGMHMLQRLDGLLPDSARSPALRPTLGEAPYVGEVVPPSQINRMAGNYDKDECNFKHVRAGALDYRDLPSRRGNMLVYRDGRTVPIDHANVQPQPPQARSPVPAAPTTAAAPTQPKRRRAA